MEMNLSLANQIQESQLGIPVLKVMGLGGGGSNAVNRMIELGLTGVEYIAANTDSQALHDSLADTKIQLGPELTRGLGAGGDPRIGEAAARESFMDIKRALEGADMVFLTAGMGGGTGTGSIPVATEIAQSINAVTVGVVTTPFSFEIGKRQTNANEGLALLREHTDTLITVPNDRLLKIAARNLPLELAFRLADDVLRQGIQGITQLVTQSGLINVDFAHIRELMLNGGGSLLSIGYGQGEHKALQAVDQALHHPLLESIDLTNATGIIANISGGEDLTFLEIAEALSYLQKKTNNGADIIPGFIQDNKLRDKAEIIMVITGLGATALDEEFIQTQEQEAFPIIESSILANTSPKQPVYESAPSSTNSDLPAFMRRRYH